MKIDLTFGATIAKDENGTNQLRVNNRAYFLTRLAKVPEGKVTLHVYNKKENRSTQQNRYYWAYLRMIEDETGNDSNDIHEYAKRKFLAPRHITVNDETIKIPQSTTNLNKSDFTEYLMKIEAWSGVALPNPEDAGYITN